MVDLAYEDYQYQYYINRAIAPGIISDMERNWYIQDLGAGPSLYYLTINDLELLWLKSKTADPSNDIDDQWYIYLSPLYGNLSVTDLKYALYKAG